MIAEHLMRDCLFVATLALTGILLIMVFALMVYHDR